MNDPILAARLKVLQEYLKLTVNSQDWLEEKFKLPVTTDRFWAALDRTIGKRAKDLVDQLESAGQDVEAQDAEAQARSLEDAWRVYVRVFKESQKIFSAYLEFVGSLTIREHLIQEPLCEMADELIRNCAMGSTRLPWEFFAVPSLHEPAVRTMTQSVRLRFPEWTVWTLPLSVREYWYVVLQEKVIELQRLISNDAATLLRVLKLESADPANEFSSWTKKNAEAYVSELLADAFATYIVGPAYGCAAILSHLNPLLPPPPAGQDPPAQGSDNVEGDDDSDAEKRPSDIERAQVILAALSRLQRTGDYLGIEQVTVPCRDNWTQLLKLGGGQHAIRADRQKFLEGLADHLFDVFPKLVWRPYPADHKGWHKAAEWALNWAGQLEKAQDLVNQPTETNDLRDVLNAAWICRIKRPEKQDDIAGAVKKLATDVIRGKARAREQNQRSGKSKRR